jgi:hypothetical protein
VSGVNPSTDCNSFPLNEDDLIKPKAIDLSAKFGISLRAAYRCIKLGRVPSGQRKVGKDGKSYPVRGHADDAADRDLRLTWQALNRARRNKANDVELLTRIFGLASAMLKEAA